MPRNQSYFKSVPVVPFESAHAFAAAEQTDYDKKVENTNGSIFGSE